MRQSNRLIINVFTNYIQLFLYGIINFILVGYIVRKLGKEAFGIVSLVMSLIIIIELIGAGFCQALSKYVSSAIETEDDKRISKLFTNAFVWLTLCALFGTVICLALSSYITKLYDIPQKYIMPTKYSMYLIVIRLLLFFPGNAYEGVLLAYQRYDIRNICRIVTIIFRLIGTIICFEFFSAGIVQVILIIILSLLVERIMWVIAVRRINKRIVFRVNYISKKDMYLLMSFGGFIFIITLANLLGYEAIKWIVGVELTFIDVGAYVLIATIAAFTGQIARAISTVLMPVSSKFESLNQGSKNTMLTLLSTKYVMITAGLTCIVPIFVINPFLEFWVGGEYNPIYREYMSNACVILLFGQWCISSSICMLQMLSGIGRVKVPSFITISWSIGGITIMWLFLHFIGKSLMAAVIIISISRVIGSIAHIIYGIKVLSLQYREFLWRAIFKPAMAAGLVAIIGKMLLLNLRADTIFNFVLIIFTLFFSFCVFVWFFVIDDFEKKITADRIKGLFNRICG